MTKIMQMIVDVGSDHNLSHPGEKPPKGGENGGVIEGGRRNGECGTIKK
jgi:hypothetical protein